jgi:hypothetical protein
MRHLVSRRLLAAAPGEIQRAHDGAVRVLDEVTLLSPAERDWFFLSSQRPMVAGSLWESANARLDICFGLEVWS